MTALDEVLSCGHTRKTLQNVLHFLKFLLTSLCWKWCNSAFQSCIERTLWEYYKWGNPQQRSWLSRDGTVVEGTIWAWLRSEQSYLGDSLVVRFQKSWQRKLPVMHESCCKTSSHVGCGYASCQVQWGQVWCNESTVWKCRGHRHDWRETAEIRI